MDIVDTDVPFHAGQHVLVAVVVTRQEEINGRRGVLIVVINVVARVRVIVIQDVMLDVAKYVLVENVEPPVQEHVSEQRVVIRVLQHAQLDVELTVPETVAGQTVREPARRTAMQVAWTPAHRHVPRVHA